MSSPARPENYPIPLQTETFMRITVRLSIVLSLAIATSLQAITYIVPNDRDLVKRAEAIVVATAAESHPELRDGGRIVTVATLNVERVLKGLIEGARRG